jgi:hypothetical protein
MCCASPVVLGLGRGAIRAWDLLGAVVDDAPPTGRRPYRVSAGHEFLQQARGRGFGSRPRSESVNKSLTWALPPKGASNPTGVVNEFLTLEALSNPVEKTRKLRSQREIVH